MGAMKKYQFFTINNQFFSCLSRSLDGNFNIHVLALKIQIYIEGFSKSNGM